MKSFWPTKKLGKLCDISMGFTPSRGNSKFWGAGYNWLSIADMSQGKDLLTTKETITSDAVNDRMNKLIQPGNLLMSFKLSIGKLGFARIPMFTNEAIVALPVIDKNELLPDYLYYALDAIDLEKGTDRAVMGSTLNKAKLEEIEIPLPPLDEQRRIAAILDKADAIRRKRQESIRLTEEFLRSTFLEMFGDPMTNPKGWKTFKMESLILDGPQNGLYRHESDYGSGTPIIRIDSFYDGEITGLEKIKRVRLDANTVNKYLLEEDDILVNRVNSRKFLGKSAIVPKLIEDTVFESNMMRFKVDTNKVCPHYLVSLLQQPYLKKQIDGRAKDAVNQSSINQDDVKSFEMRLPPLELQKKFSQIKSAANKARFRLNDVSVIDCDLFCSLIHRAFRGEL